MKKIGWIDNFLIFALFAAALIGCVQGRWNPLDPRYDPTTDPESDWKGDYGSRVLDAAGDVGFPSSIAVLDSNVYVSYMDRTNYDLRLAKSTDEGKTWIYSVVASEGSVGDSNAIAVSGSNVYISYHDDTATKQLMLAKSNDGGESWELQQIDATFSSRTFIRAAGTNIYICYLAVQGVKLAISTDGGSIWVTKLVGGTGNVISFAESGSSDFHVSYVSGTDDKLYYAKSTNGGDSWTTTEAVSESVGEFNALAIDGSNIYISYFDQDRNQLRFAKSTDEGNSWGNSLVTEEAVHFTHDMDMDYDGELYISYLESENLELKVAKSTNSGVSWSTVLADDKGGEQSHIVVQSGPIFITYYGFNDTALHFVKSNYSGEF